MIEDELRKEIEVNRKQTIIIVDEALTDCFGINFRDIKGDLKPNTLLSAYAGIVMYYFKFNIGLKINTISDLFHKPHDKITIQLNLFEKHIIADKNNIIFAQTISRDRKEIVENLYPIFLANIKTFVVEIFAKRFEIAKKELSNIEANKKRCQTKKMKIV